MYKKGYNTTPAQQAQFDIAGNIERTLVQRLYLQNKNYFKNLYFTNFSKSIAFDFIDVDHHNRLINLWEVKCRNARHDQYDWLIYEKYKHTSLLNIDINYINYHTMENFNNYKINNIYYLNFFKDNSFFVQCPTKMKLKERPHNCNWSHTMDLGKTDKNVYEMRPEERLNKNIYVDTLIIIDRKQFVNNIIKNYEVDKLDIKNIIYRFGTEYQTIYK